MKHIDGPPFIRAALREAGFPEVANVVRGGAFAHFDWERLGRLPTLAEVTAAGRADDLWHVAVGWKLREDRFTPERWLEEIEKWTKVLEAEPEYRLHR